MEEREEELEEVEWEGKRGGEEGLREWADVRIGTAKIVWPNC